MSIPLKNKKIITNFIKTNHKKNHILVTNNKVFNYYYKSKKKLNFILAKEKKDIKSIIGYIPFEKYNSRFKILWIALWIGSKKKPLSGLDSLSVLLKKFYNYDIFCLGLTEKAKKILNLYGFTTGKLHHYYLVNPYKKKFKFIKKPQRIRSFYHHKNLLDVKLITKKNCHYLNTFKNRSEKNSEYFKSKYLFNPFYNYQIYLIKTNYLKSLLVLRIVKKKIIRIIDFSGDEKIIQYLYPLFQKIFKEKGYEYLDFLNYGLNYKYLKKANFRLIKKPTIIPNFFEPLVFANQDINFAFKKKSINKKVLIFKGDGDQERPNNI